MNKFAIVSDTSHDLEVPYLKENKIDSVSFYVRLDEENYLKDGVDIDRVDLYKHLRANPDVFPKTSLPSVDDYLQAFKKNLAEGLDVLCFTVASSLSGSNQSANVAANIAMEEYTDRKVYVIDSRSASLGVGILIEKAVELRNKGLDIDKVKDIVINMSLTTTVYILMDTLDYLEKGGRISKGKAIAGNLLRIKPIASFKNNSLNKEAAVRGSKKAINEGLRLLDEDIKDKPEDYEVFVIHGDSQELADDIKMRIEEKYNIKLKHTPPLVSGAVISHLGPGAIGIGFIKKID